MAERIVRGHTSPIDGFDQLDGEQHALAALFEQHGHTFNSAVNGATTAYNIAGHLMELGIGRLNILDEDYQITAEVLNRGKLRGEGSFVGLRLAIVSAIAKVRRALCPGQAPPSWAPTGIMTQAAASGGATLAAPQAGVGSTAPSDNTKPPIKGQLTRGQALLREEVLQVAARFKGKTWQEVKKVGPSTCSQRCAVATCSLPLRAAVRV